MAAVRSAADVVDCAVTEIEAIANRCSREGFHVQHHSVINATVVIHLYRGDGTAAWENIDGKEQLYRRSMLWRVQQVRIDFLQLRARAALMAAGKADDPGPLLRSAERDARKLERESAGWGRALGALMRACVREARRGPGGPGRFAAAADQLEAADLGVNAAAARYRQGERTPGPDGQRLRDAAVAWLTGRGVRHPLRMIRAHAPTPRPDGA